MAVWREDVEDGLTGEADSVWHYREMLTLVGFAGFPFLFFFFYELQLIATPAAAERVN